MNHLQAMRDTLDAARAIGLDNTNSDTPELDFPHLEDMLRRAELAASGQGEPMSEGKMGRWLGWMQASVVAMAEGALRLEHMKNINMAHRD
jgi:hypothetical protein